MIDCILDADNMSAAWQDVLSKKGAPGLDGVNVSRWNRNWEANIARIREQVRANTYRAGKPKRISIHKKSGGTREICLLNVSDKVLQRAMLTVINPLFEARFLNCSHGYRRNRSCATAVQQVLHFRDLGYRLVLNADIDDCFDKIDQTLLMERVRRVISDWFVLNLMEKWLAVSRRKRHQALGIPQGAVISPLWCNIYLHNLDARLSCAGCKLVRYADDFILLARSVAEMDHAQTALDAVITASRLALSPQKTYLSDFDSGFTFLGVDFLRDTYSYTCEDKRVEVRGRKLKALYRHPPAFY